MKIITPEVPLTSIKSGRIEIVDALRGFAVFGILVSHCYSLFFLGITTNTNNIDNSISTFIDLFVNDKFYSLFSFSFGLSFSLMLARSTEPSTKFFLRYVWRLFLLGIIGILHNLHWNDDILSIYAVLGLILLPISKFNNKIIFLIAIILLLNVPGIFIKMAEQPVTQEETLLKNEADMMVFMAFDEAIREGSYFDTIKANISIYKYKLQYYLYSGRFSFMLGFFCLGLIAGRKHLFQNFKENKIFFKKVFIWTGLIAAMLTVVALIVIINGKTENTFWASYFGYLMQWQSNVMTIAYVSGMALFFNWISVQWLTKQFVSVGKMALTNYILHSVIGTVLLCGYGFGLINHPISVTIATISSIPIFIFIILFSRLWMHIYMYGPLEWIWRSLIYFRFMPMKKK